jgi:hypothetical protein
MNLPPSSSQPSPDFDYTALDSDTRSVIKQKTSEIKKLIRRSAQDIIDIGQMLTEVKEHIGHGSFRAWLQAEFNWSVATANRFMQVAEKFKCLNLIHLDIATSALYLLARPSTPEEAHQEALERAAQGETITHAAAKEIVAHHTIDIKAEVMEDDEEPPASHQPTPEPASPSPPDPDQAREEAAPPAEPYQVGDRIRIVRRQHGEDKWSGAIARIREITPDGRLRVDLEGAKGVRFTLNPDWVEPMETPESYKVQPEQVSPPQRTEEPAPEFPRIAGAASEKLPANQPTLQLQAGDRLRLANLEQSGQQWVGEVDKVLQVAEGEIEVIVKIRSNR